MNDLIQRLQAWFVSQCDGDWEHAEGIQIGSLDNPGWTLKVDLEDTYLGDVPFQEMRLHYDHETEWMICRKQEKMFDAAGGPEQLGNMIKVFLEWAESSRDKET